MRVDQSILSGLIIITVGALATLPSLFAWSDGHQLTLRGIGPGAMAQACGLLIATRSTFGAVSISAVIFAWAAIVISLRDSALFVVSGTD